MYRSLSSQPCGLWWLQEPQDREDDLEWAALHPPYLKPGTRGPHHPPVTTLLKSFCTDDGQNSVPAKINGKTPADAGETRTSRRAPGVSQDNSPVTSAASERARDTKKN